MDQEPPTPPDNRGMDHDTALKLLNKTLLEQAHRLRLAFVREERLLATIAELGGSPPDQPDEDEARRSIVAARHHDRVAEVKATHRATLDIIGDHIDLLMSRLVDYTPVEHTTGVIEQNFGTGIVPLRHALWMLEEMESRVIVGQATMVNIALDFHFVLGVMFAFAQLSREEVDTFKQAWCDG